MNRPDGVHAPMPCPAWCRLDHRDDIDLVGVHITDAIGTDEQVRFPGYVHIIQTWSKYDGARDPQIIVREPLSDHQAALDAGAARGVAEVVERVYVDKAGWLPQALRQAADQLEAITSQTPQEGADPTR